MTFVTIPTGEDFLAFQGVGVAPQASARDNVKYQHVSYNYSRKVA